MARLGRTRENAADRIYDSFVDAIVTGHFKSGVKLPTMQKIADLRAIT